MGHTVKVNPLVVLVTVLVGKEPLGLAGSVFAIPMEAALAVVVDEWHHERTLDDQNLQLDGATQVLVEP
jgi:predicted PurR-regulated permease PerM